MSQLTKKALLDSFVKLLNQTSLDKITVKDIAQDCGVNRNTFYYHFKDIYSMLDEIFQAETKRVTEETKEYGSWQESFLMSTKFALENKRAIYHIYNSLSREQLEQYLYNVTDSVMISFVESAAQGMDCNHNDVLMLANFYKHAMVGLVLDWLKNGMKEDPEYVINRLGVLLDGNVKIALANGKKNPASK
ncbi:MAG: TetR/AcrR family transcriptional regulator C-terminal domain-containing protein [Clostridiales bacterium]|nr:TetR/AcrR family transcriptional regulator C-terminal domain-containing protein [Clostridiales bacterium]